MAIIGIDIDDTIVKTNEKAIEIIKREGYSMVSYYEKIADLSSFISKHFVEIVKNAELFDNAKEIINTLKENGHEIVLISSRAYQEGADTVEDTVNYLNEKGISFDKIVLRSPNKVAACLENNVEIFIDDKEKTLDQLAEVGLECIKFSSIDKTESKYRRIDKWDTKLIDIVDRLSMIPRKK